jgi:formate transporter
LFFKIIIEFSFKIKYTFTFKLIIEKLIYGEQIMSNFLTPPEISQSFIKSGEKKVVLPIPEMFILGMLAGVFIGFAAHLATVVSTGTCDWYGLKKLLMGAAFTVGLMLVVIPGSELWTGNALMTMSLMQRKITFAGMMKNWVFVYLGNFVGSVMLAFFIAKSSGLLNGDVGGSAIKIAYAKVHEQIPGISHNYGFFFRGIGCNWLVCLAVMLATASKDITGKIFGIFFPIMAFVASGFEHCVANMYFIPAGIFAMDFEAAKTASGIDPMMLYSLNWGTMWTNNIITVTLGNLVGGGFFTGIVYWWLYVRGKTEPASQNPTA